MTIASIPRAKRAWLSPLAAAAVLTGGLAALGGCSHDLAASTETVGSVPADYRVNHPIAVEEGVSTLDVPVGIYTDRMTDAMRANVVGFAQSYKASGSALIAVVAPSGSPNQTVAAGIAVEIEDVLRKSGIAAGSIDYRVYHAGSDERNAPIRVAFSSIKAETAPCTPWSDQLSVNHDNTPYFAFGCATQQNLAAVVDNPLDLLYPRGLTPADAARRSNVLDLYRQGKTFTADLGKDSGGKVAQGFNQ